MTALKAFVHSNLFRSLSIMKMRGMSLVAKFLLTIFIARYMDLEALGVYGLIVGVCTLVPVAVSFGIINNFARTAVTQPIDKVTGTLVLYIFTFSAIYAALGLLAVGGASLAGKGLFVFYIVLITATEHANNDVFTLLNNLRKPIAANISFFIRSGLWIYAYIAAAFLFPQFRTIDALLLAWVAGGVIALAYFWFVSRKWPWNFKVSCSSCRKWFAGELHHSKILYLNDIANTASQYLDRYLITVFLGLELTGVYVLFWSISNALANLVRTGTITLFRPTLISSYANDFDLYKKTFRTCLRQTLLVSFALSIAAFIVLHFAIPFLKQPLAEENFLVYGLVLASFVGRMLYEVLGVVFYSRHEDMKTFVTGLYLFAASVILPALCIPLWGLTGAGWAVLLTVLIGSLARYLTLKAGGAHAHI